MLTLKEGTSDAGMSVLSPVRGLPLCRAICVLVENVSNPEILTVSLFASAPPIGVNTALTTLSASARDSEASEATRDEGSTCLIP